MSSGLQALDVAFDVDKAFALQPVEGAPRSGLRTSAGVGNGFDFGLTGASTSGTGGQISVDCQLVWCQTVVKNSGAHLEESVIQISHYVLPASQNDFFHQDSRGLTILQWFYIIFFGAI